VSFGIRPTCFEWLLLGMSAERQVQRTERSKAPLERWVRRASQLMRFMLQYILLHLPTQSKPSCIDVE